VSTVHSVACLDVKKVTGSHMIMEGPVLRYIVRLFDITDILWCAFTKKGEGYIDIQNDWNELL